MSPISTRSSQRIFLHPALCVRQRGNAQQWIKKKGRLDLPGSPSCSSSAAREGLCFEFRDVDVETCCLSFMMPQRSRCVSLETGYVYLIPVLVFQVRSLYLPGSHFSNLDWHWANFQAVNVCMFNLSRSLSKASHTMILRDRSESFTVCAAS